MKLVVIIKITKSIILSSAVIRKTREAVGPGCIRSR
jgi:hypothetical protein